MRCVSAMTLSIVIAVATVCGAGTDVAGRTVDVQQQVAPQATGGVYQPNSVLYGKRLAEWTAEWWQFVLSIHAADNPLLDETGEKCAVAQRGPVWMLRGSVGGTVTRSCAVPEGKALLFPILNIVDINTTTQTAAELRAEISPIMDGATNLSVEIDGVPVEAFERHTDDFRIRSVAFDVTLPPDNIVGLPAGTYSPAVDDGYYVMLAPLPIGTHAIRFRGGLPAQGGFFVDVAYDLTVVAASLK